MSDRQRMTREARRRYLRKKAPPTLRKELQLWGVNPQYAKGIETSVVK